MNNFAESLAKLLESLQKTKGKLRVCCASAAQYRMQGRFWLQSRVLATKAILAVFVGEYNE